MVEITSKEKLETLIELLQHSRDQGEMLDDFTADVWAMIQDPQMWETGFMSISKLKQAMGYEENIKPILIRKRTTAERKINCSDTVMQD